MFSQRILPSGRAIYIVCNTRQDGITEAESIHSNWKNQRKCYILGGITFWL